MDTVTGLGLQMLSGFGNEFATEALAGALPVGRNSPQRPAFGLYAEQISSSPFTVPRRESRRSWLYRIRPSALHPAYHRIDNGRLGGAMGVQLQLTASVPVMVAAAAPNSDPRVMSW